MLACSALFEGRVLVNHGSLANVRNVLMALYRRCLFWRLSRRPTRTAGDPVSTAFGRHAHRQRSPRRVRGRSGDC